MGNKIESSISALYIKLNKSKENFNKAYQERFTEGAGRLPRMDIEKLSVNPNHANKTSYDDIQSLKNNFIESLKNFIKDWSSKDIKIDFNFKRVFADRSKISSAKKEMLRGSQRNSKEISNNIEKLEKIFPYLDNLIRTVANLDYLSQKYKDELHLSSAKTTDFGSIEPTTGISPTSATVELGSQGITNQQETLDEFNFPSEGQNIEDMKTVTELDITNDETLITDKKIEELGTVIDFKHDPTKFTKTLDQLDLKINQEWDGAVQSTSTSLPNKIESIENFFTGQNMDGDIQEQALWEPGFNIFQKGSEDKPGTSYGLSKLSNSRSMLSLKRKHKLESLQLIAQDPIKYTYKEIFENKENEKTNKLKFFNWLKAKDQTKLINDNDLSKQAIKSLIDIKFKTTPKKARWIFFKAKDTNRDIKEAILKELLNNEYSRQVLVEFINNSKQIYLNFFMREGILPAPTYK